MKSLLLLLLVVLPLFCVGLGGVGLIDPDEGRYAEIPREMLERHDLLSPTLNGVLYAEKPPLLDWLVAGSFELFGPSERAARLVPVASALLSVLVAWRLGRRMFGERAGLLGAVILATNLLFAFLARALVIDMLFAALVQLALACWWCGHRENSGRDERDGRDERGGSGRGGHALLYDAGFWSSLALAVLAKGPVAVVLVGGALGLYVVLCGQWAALVRRSLLFTAPLLPLIAAPWFVLMSRRHADFDHFYWYEQHVGRFTGGDGSGYHESSYLYFVGWLPLLFFPWSFFVPAALADGWRRLLPATTERRRAAVYLLGGALFVTLFFSASSGKLMTYVLPAFPPVALCLGAWFDRRLERGANDGSAGGRALLRTGALLVPGALLAGAVALAWRGPGLLAKSEGLGPTIAYSLAALLAAGAACVLVALARRRLTAMLACVAATIVLVFLTFALVAPQLDGNHSVKALVERIRPGLDRGARLVSYCGYTPALCFYAQRRVFVNGKLGELHFGADRLPPDERALWFADDDRRVVARQLAAPEPTYCAVNDHDAALELLPELGPDVREIVWNDRCSILGNGAAAALTPPVGHVVPGLQPDALHSIAPPGRK